MFKVSSLSCKTSNCTQRGGIFVFRPLILLRDFHGILSSMFFRHFSHPVASTFASLRLVKIQNKVKVFAWQVLNGIMDTLDPV